MDVRPPFIAQVGFEHVFKIVESALSNVFKSSWLWVTEQHVKKYISWETVVDILTPN